MTPITDAYTNIEVIECPVDIDPRVGDPLVDGISFGNVDCWEPDTVLLPDSGAFMNSGKYAILFWVLDSDPNYATYYTTWQIPDPKPELYNFIAEDGTIPPGGGDGIWETFFEPINRIQGYQFSRLFAEGRKYPVARGHFSSKEDAVQCFDSVLNITNLIAREKAPYIHASATQEEYLKELSHVGEKMVLKKVNIIDKKAYKDSAVKLITYKALPPNTN